EHDDLGFEQDIGRRRRERRDAGRGTGRAGRRRLARPQAEHRDTAEAQRTRERGGNGPRADDEGSGIASGHGRYRWWVAIYRNTLCGNSDSTPGAPAASSSRIRVAEIPGIAMPVSVVPAGGSKPLRPTAINGAFATTSFHRYHFAVSPRMSAPMTRRSSRSGA